MEKFFRVVDRIGPNPRFFRALAILLILGFVMAKMPWVNHIVGYSIGIADLRHSVVFGWENGRAVLFVKAINAGQKKADNVIISVRSEDEEYKFEDYSVDSDEIYEVLSKDDREIIVRLSRLAPGAEFVCRVKGVFTREGIKVSIVSDQGKSSSIDLPTLNAQISRYTSALENLYTSTLLIGRREIVPLFRKIQLLSYLRKHVGGFASLEGELLASDFKTLLRAWLVIGIIIGLFFPRLTVLIPLTFASIFLFLKSQVACALIIAPFSLTLAIIVILGFIGCFSNNNTKMILPCFGGLVMLSGVAIVPFFFAQAPLCSAKFLFIPAFYVALVMLAVISYIVPPMPECSSSVSNVPIEQRLTVHSKLDLENIDSLENNLRAVINYLEYFNKKMRHQDIHIQRLQAEIASLHEDFFSGKEATEVHEN